MLCKYASRRLSIRLAGDHLGVDQQVRNLNKVRLGLGSRPADNMCMSFHICEVLRPSSRECVNAGSCVTFV
jgi:hypothetical protein